MAGCGNSTPASVPIEMLGSSYAAVSCGLIRDCYGDAVLTALYGVSSEAACETRAAAGYVNAALPRYQAAITMGTLSYDGTFAQDCLDAIHASGCAAITGRTPDACNALFTGHVAAGGACAIDEECAGDAYCLADAACPGTCQAFGGPGASCTRDQACQQGLQCSNGNCQTPGGVGASCQGMTGVDCNGGLICQGGTATQAGTCAATSTVFGAASGAACNVQMQQLCSTGISCIVMSATSQTCGPDNLASGAACHLSAPDQCQPGFYCHGATVMAAGTCMALPAAGQPCATVPFGASCADGSVCDSMMCVAVQANGGACPVDDDCFGGRCSAGSCAVPTYCPPAP
jgi:hypothetical protein